MSHNLTMSHIENILMKNRAYRRKCVLPQQRSINCVAAITVK